MVDVEEFGNFETAWCPGCGNHALLSAVKKALSEEGLKPHQVLFVSGIGQAAKAPHYLRANFFNGLHGRALPVATGAKLVVSPCHNCWDAIRDMEEIYKIGIRWSFLKPLLISMVEVPEHMKVAEQ